MTISKARLANAYAAVTNGVNNWTGRSMTPFEGMVEKALEADDAFRASQLNPELEASRAKAIMAGQSDTEPKLPEGVHQIKLFPSGRQVYVVKDSQDEVSLYLYPEWNPERLRAIASHMEWKSRAAEREAAGEAPLTASEIAALRVLLKYNPGLAEDAQRKGQK